MGESKEDVVDMLLELREIQPEALPINFLLPIPGTPPLQISNPSL